MKLKNCPFCGGEPYIYQFSEPSRDVGMACSEAYTEAYVKCLKCRASTATVRIGKSQVMEVSREDEESSIYQAMDLWEQRAG
jgi:hypothetical protein